MSAERSRPSFLERLRKHHGGSAAIEFGFVAPALIMSILGIFWFGWSMHNASSLTYALDQAGRAYQLNPAMTQSALQTLVSTELKDISDASVIVNVVVGANSNGTQLATISGSYSRTLSVPFLNSYKYTIQRSVTVPVAAN